MKSVLMVVANPFAYDQRVHNEAKTLSENGYSVTVLAWDRMSEFGERETVEGFEVVRFRNDRLYSFLQRRPLQLMRFWEKGYRFVTQGDKQFDILHCHDLDTLKIGIKLKQKHGCKLVYDSHEIFLYLIQRDLTKYLTRHYRRIEREGCKIADLVITVDEKHIDYFKSNYGVRNIEVVRNTKSLFTEEYIPPPDNHFRLVYIGTLSKPRFILETIEVVAELQNVHLTIAGLGPIAKQVKKSAAKKQNVTFLGPVPIAQIVKLTLDAHVALCMIDPSDLNNRVNPANKQFEAMVCGRPIIVTAGTRVAEMTREENCGIVVEYTKEALKKGILKLQNEPKLSEQLGKNALQAAQKKYSWQIDSATLLAIYKNLTVRDAV